MPDSRRFRGEHPSDAGCFSAESLPVLRQAVEDLSWLLDRGYSARASAELVGNRFQLQQRQRKAVQRCAVSPTDCAEWHTRCLGREDLAGQSVVLDGFNILLTLETALSGGVLLVGADGLVRDLAAMSAHYRRLHVTQPAVARLAEFLDRAAVSDVLFLLDRPVSNSGRLKGVVESEVSERAVPWRVELADQVDRRLAESSAVVMTADRAILGRCDRWYNLVAEMLSDDSDLVLNFVRLAGE